MKSKGFAKPNLEQNNLLSELLFIYRAADSELVINTVSNEVSLILDPIQNKTIRQQIANQLNFTNPDPV